MNMTETEYRIREIKSARIQGEAFIQTVRALPKTRESALVITKAQEAVMWLGMMLKEMGTLILIRNPTILKMRSWNPRRTA